MRDSKLTKCVLVALMLATAICVSADGEIKVSARLEQGASIYVGENFIYSVVIEGSGKPSQIDLASIMKFNPQNAGNQLSTRTVNFETTTEYIMNYSLTVNQPGLIEIPSVTVTVNGENYQTNPVKVNILKPGTTDKLQLEFALSQQQCYVGQPVIMSVKWTISALLKNANFNVPVFSSNDFYIEDVSEAKKAWAQNEYIINGVAVLLQDQRLVIKGVESRVISFTKVLIPKHSGKIEIAPVSVSAEIAVGRSRQRNAFFGPQYEYKRFMTTSKPATLTVLPLPEQGRPAGYYGLVGRYTIAASAAPTKVNVGDPITLTIKIGGNKYLKPVQWPGLEDVPELAANFKIPLQKASPAIEGDSKVFTQTIRANNDRVTAIPPIPLAFFDSDSGQYTIAKTKPIKLEVAPTKILTSADLEGADFTPVNKEVEAIKKGLSANYEGFDVLENQSFLPATVVISPGYMALWGLPLSGLILSLLIKFFTHTSPEKTAAKRRRQACGKAVRQLKKSISAGQQRHELVASVMKQYIGNRFDKTVGSLTADDCHEVIVNSTQDIETANKYRDIIAQSEAVRYASVETDIDLTQIKKVIELVRNIEKKSKK
ncbi:MAG: BatD family protein [Planctomycetota bacterium]|jgi:hypothetical protein